MQACALRISVLYWILALSSPVCVFPTSLRLVRMISSAFTTTRGTRTTVVGRQRELVCALLFSPSFSVIVAETCPDGAKMVRYPTTGDPLGCNADSQCPEFSSWYDFKTLFFQNVDIKLRVKVANKFPA